ncbi:MAG: GumC family protein [Planctomycetota bacterium]
MIHSSDRYQEGGSRSLKTGSADILLGMQPDAQLTTNTLRHLGHVFYRYRFRMLGFFACVMGAVVTALVYWPRTYTSEAKLLVRVGRSSIAVDPTVTTGQVISLQDTRQTEVASALEVIASRSTLETVVDTAMADKPFPTPLERDKALNRLEGNLSLSNPEQSSVIVVTYDDESPEGARRVVDKLVKTFLNEHLRVNSAPGSFEFFEEQAEVLKAQWEQATRELEEAKNEYQLASIDGRRVMLEQQLAQIEQKQINNQVSLATTEAKIATLRGQGEEVPNSLVRDFALGLPSEESNTMRQQLFQLENREKELLSRYRSDHPEVVAVREQIDQTSSALDTQRFDRSQATSAALLTEVVEQRVLRAEQSSLAQHHEDVHHHLADLNHQETHIRDLQRQAEILDAKYQRYVDSLEQTRIQRELEQDEISNISVIQPASLVVKPTSPKKGLVLALGLFLATCGSLGLALVSERLDSSLRYPSQIEQCFEVPLLTSIPRTRKKLKIAQG